MKTVCSTSTPVNSYNRSYSSCSTIQSVRQLLYDMLSTEQVDWVCLKQRLYELYDSNINFNTTMQDIDLLKKSVLYTNNKLNVGLLNCRESVTIADVLHCLLHFFKITSDNMLQQDYYSDPSSLLEYLDLFKMCQSALKWTTLLFDNL